MNFFHLIFCGMIIFLYLLNVQLNLTNPAILADVATLKRTTVLID